MSDENRQLTSSLFTQVDISASNETSDTRGHGAAEANTAILRQVLAALDRNNELLEELVQHSSAAQKQRSHELEQWKKGNPDLARACRLAADALSRVQTEYLNTLTEEIEENGEVMMDGEFMLSEFVDRFGPRLAHLNGILQVLSQLGATPTPNKKSAG